MDSLFTKIIKGELPTNKVYENEHTFALLDINPINPGHVLVVPKEPYHNIYDIPEETWCEVMKTVKKVALATKKAMHADGINILMNNDSAAGQEVIDHAHIKIVPRFKNDGFSEWKGTPYKDGEAAQVAEKIRNAF